VNLVKRGPTAQEKHEAYVRAVWLMFLRAPTTPTAPGEMRRQKCDARRGTISPGCTRSDFILNDLLYCPKVMTPKVPLP
jgi:hypothetical protein